VGKTAGGSLSSRLDLRQLPQGLLAEEPYDLCEFGGTRIGRYANDAVACSPDGLVERSAAL
jgi:hypothetical protein